MIELPPMTPPLKRSLAIDGHSTSISLEDAFWRGAQSCAQTRGMTRAALIAEIDHARPPGIGLATAVRLFVLHQAQLAPPPDGG